MSRSSVRTASRRAYAFLFVTTLTTELLPAQSAPTAASRQEGAPPAAEAADRHEDYFPGPGDGWVRKEPGEVGLDPAALATYSSRLTTRARSDTTCGRIWPSGGSRPDRTARSSAR